MQFSTAAPIGVFDSGMGGLSILRALQTALPQEDFVYFADSAHTPYGEKSEDFIVQRSLHIAQLLRRDYGVKALVIACNTATAAAADTLRQTHPDLPIIGVEPAIKPACTSSQTGHIAVLATPHTIASARLARLVAQYGGGCQVHLQACSGLAKAIENLPHQPHSPQAQHLLQQHLAALPRPCGTGPGEIDTVVLGCTHYPLLQAAFAGALPAGVRLLETGPAVAKQTQACLTPHGLHPADGPTGQLRLIGSGSAADLQEAAQYWGIHSSATATPPTAAAPLV